MASINSFAHHPARYRLAVGLVISLVGVLGAAGPASGSAPGPAAGSTVRQPGAEISSALPFVSNVDLQCLETMRNEQPTTSLSVTHLHPVFFSLMPLAEVVTFSSHSQLCVPVVKNNRVPPQPLLDYLQWVDLACYPIGGIPPIHRWVFRTTQINAALPPSLDKGVFLIEPDQFCLPVAKNGNFPPESVIWLIEYIALKCYRISPNISFDLLIDIAHINPLLTSLPTTSVLTDRNRQLCVPVRVNDDPAMPGRVREVLQYLVLEKHELRWTEPQPMLALQLDHLCPVLVRMPPEGAITLPTGRQEIMLPVAVDGRFPPDGPFPPRE